MTPEEEEILEKLDQDVAETERLVREVDTWTRAFAALLALLGVILLFIEEARTVPLFFLVAAMILVVPTVIKKNRKNGQTSRYPSNRNQ